MRCRAESPTPLYPPFPTPVCHHLINAAVLRIFIADFHKAMIFRIPPSSIAKAVFLLMTLFAAVDARAQHPLVGTWEMISVKGIDADGNPFFFDTTAVKETKIITPTHYMLIAWDVEKDSLLFNRTMAGQVRLENEKYIEIPTQASVQIFENIKVDFTWKLEGDVFTQSGTIIRPDGKSVLLEALIFKRADKTKSDQRNPAIGTWSQVADQYTTDDGTSNTSFNKSDKRMLIVTPTHWMRMDHKNDKFEGIFYGTYSSRGNAITTSLDYSNHPFKKGTLTKFTQKVNGDQLHITSTGTTADGKPATFYGVWEKQK